MEYNKLVKQLEKVNEQLEKVEFDLILKDNFQVNRALKKVMKSRQSFLLNAIKNKKHNL